MDRGLYVAMSGAGELMRAQAVHANNLANVNTVGFRADLAQSRAMPVFADALPSRAYAMTERPAVNQDTGVLVETGRPLDVAVAGDGWIAVLARDGSEAYTRAGVLVETGRPLDVAVAGDIKGARFPWCPSASRPVELQRSTASSSSIHRQPVCRRGWTDCCVLPVARPARPMPKCSCAAGSLKAAMSTRSTP